MDVALGCLADFLAREFPWMSADDTIEEVSEIITKPFSEEKRQLGFEHALGSDISQACWRDSDRVPGSGQKKAGP